MISESIIWNNKKLTIETGEIARQADGAVLIHYGNSSVLCTCVYNKELAEEVGFFPLTVNYQERFYSAGKLPSGFIKREGKPSDHETLISRLIDRPIRPLFPDGFYNEVQIICSLLSYDPECDPAITAMIGASAAISISGVPFNGPIAGCKVGYRQNECILNPVIPSDMDLTIAGSKDGILMVESQINELPEHIVLEAVMFGFNNIQPVIDLINNLKHKVNKPVLPIIPLCEKYPDIYQQVLNLSKEKVSHALLIKSKLDRQTEIKNIQKQIINEFEEDKSSIVEYFFNKILSNSMRSLIANNKTRIDGRKFDQIRPISCKLDLLPQVHGSALFTRGDTQALVTTTLGSLSDGQVIDNITGETSEYFLLHYNFPPFAVGEVGRLGAPGRREIGHGRLAWKALSTVIPDIDSFPYTIRVVSEITESNGSSSMATVCGSSLSLMAAGVKIKQPVAGIAMGLIKDNDNYIILSDIMGDEDHLGDMDFKVAGTQNGITALQMDIKINSITKEIIKCALEKAKVGRLHILEIMNNTIDKAREDISQNAPRAKNMYIEKDKIRELIGVGGKVIKDICSRLNVKIEIADDGKVSICAADQHGLDAAVNEINLICFNPEVGDILDGIITKIVSFGIFVSIGPKEGLIHISKVSKDKSATLDKVFRIGQKIKVKILGVDDKNRMKLTFVDM